MRKRIAIDMDEVVADCIGKWVATYNQQWDDSLTPAHIRSWRVNDWVKPECGHQVFEIVQTPGFFRDLPVFEGAQEVIHELSQNYEIYFVTAAMGMRESLRDKYDWLHEHFPFIAPFNFVFCGDKSIIRAEYMIDDGPHNLEVFSGTPLLFHAHHNEAETRFPRFYSWWEIRDYFRSLAQA